MDSDRVSDDSPAKQVGDLLETTDLAGALESGWFKQFLDRVPVAIAVSELEPSERIIYANIEFERLTGQTSADVVGQFWNALPGLASAVDDNRELGEAVAEEGDYVGAFDIKTEGQTISVDAWSNVIQDDDGVPMFRLVVLSKSTVVARSRRVISRISFRKKYSPSRAAASGKK